MTAYYNEHDPFAAAWLRELIKAGAIADGEVDERDMWDVVPADLVRFKQCHFCAGIGGWSAALRLAGWSDYQSVWTISLPCQPFSAAGKGTGLADERGQLAEAFFWLAGICRPNVIIGEQVEAAIKHDWLDVVATSLGSIGYAVGAVGFPASSVGAYHIRQRLYWVANSERNGGRTNFQGREQEGREVAWRGSPARRVADAESRGNRGIRGSENGTDSTPHSRGENSTGFSGDTDRCGSTGIMADTEHTERRPEHQEQRASYGLDGPGRDCNTGELGDSARQGFRGLENEQSPSRSETRGHIDRPGAVNGFWRNAEWIWCRDGKWRPIQRATQSESEQMVDGLPGDLGLVRLARQTEGEIEGEEVTVYAPLVARGRNRVGRLRGYGNAICVPAAAEFVKAFM